MPKMSKPQMIAATLDFIDADEGVTRRQVAAVIEAFLATVEKVALNGNDVYLHGFGTFARRDKAARMARNPATGEAVPVSASRRLVFRAAKKAGV